MSSQPQTLQCIEKVDSDAVICNCKSLQKGPCFFTQQNVPRPIYIWQNFFSMSPVVRLINVTHLSHKRDRCWYVCGCHWCWAPYMMGTQLGTLATIHTTGHHTMYGIHDGHTAGHTDNHTSMHSTYNIHFTWHFRVRRGVCKVNICFRCCLLGVAYSYNTFHMTMPISIHCSVYVQLLEGQYPTHDAQMHMAHAHVLRSSNKFQD